MKLDTLTLAQHLEVDGVLTREQAARLVHLLCEVGVVEPGGFVVRTSRAASDGGAPAQAFVPCGREEARRMIKRRSRHFARAVEGAREGAS
jgi:hypothetical protein